MSVFCKFFFNKWIADCKLNTDIFVFFVELNGQRNNISSFCYCRLRHDLKTPTTTDDHAHTYYNVDGKS